MFNWRLILTIGVLILVMVVLVLYTNFFDQDKKPAPAPPLTNQPDDQPVNQDYRAEQTEFYHPLLEDRSTLTPQFLYP